MRIKYFLFHVVSIFLTLLVTIFVCELVLRFWDYRIKDYWHPYVFQTTEPMVNQPDPVLGWRPKPGRYVIRDVRYGNEVTYTFWQDGSRATKPVFSPDASKDRVVFIGCSLTQGWGVSDQETFAWKLQAKHPSLQFRNLGVVGYGTYQSLLLLEDYFRRAGDQPKLVIYGFIDNHQYRNVATLSWLLDLSRQSCRGIVHIPYCLQGPQGGLQCFPPMTYPRWWGDRQSYLVNFVKDLYLKWSFRNRIAQKAPVTNTLFVRMRDLCLAHHAKLYVVNLHWHAYEKIYRKLLDQDGIENFNCYDEGIMNRFDKKTGDGHPNKEVHTLFTECIEAHIGQDIK